MVTGKVETLFMLLLEDFVNGQLKTDRIHLKIKICLVSKLDFLY